MHVSEDGRVSGSVDRAKLAELYAGTDDADLREHYEYMAAFDQFDLKAYLEEFTQPEPEPAPELEPVKKAVAKKTATKEESGGDYH